MTVFEGRSPRITGPRAKPQQLGRNTKMGRPPQRRTSMARLIKCECGYIAHGESDDDVIADVQVTAMPTTPKWPRP
jgi:hypothetical protein